MKWLGRHTPEQVINKLREAEVAISENGRLRRVVVDLTLDNQILREASEGNF